MIKNIIPNIINVNKIIIIQCSLLEQFSFPSVNAFMLFCIAKFVINAHIFAPLHNSIITIIVTINKINAITKLNILDAK